MITLEFTDAATMEQQAVQAVLPCHRTDRGMGQIPDTLTDVRRGVRMW